MNSLLKTICLVVVYNHRYENNISKIEEIYKNRFSHIYHLVPFYSGDKDNVIPVFSSSCYFEGSIAQGYRLYAKDKFTYYVFIADDLFLNPCFTENNIIEELNLSPTSGYIKNLSPLSSIYFLWVYLTKIFEAFRGEGVEYSREIPSKEKAVEKFTKLGIDYTKYYFSYNNLKHWDGSIKISDFVTHKGFWKELFSSFWKKARTSISSISWLF